MARHKKNIAVFLSWHFNCRRHRWLSHQEGSYPEIKHEHGVISQQAQSQLICSSEVNSICRVSERIRVAMDKGIFILGIL